MTRINTNVSSLVGRNNLQRANEGLSQSLTRLSTGLRINTGADDPAGLIASENLRSDITAIRRAISNTDRANQVIATADSALGQVSSLLNDIRGLVTESANAGALSDEQISANQLQVDSSLEALNRIAQTTEFQGRRLLDGSLDFLTTAGANSTNISNLQIDQANLGATGSVAVDVEVSSAATQASVDIANIPTTTTAVTASDGSIRFQAAIAQASTGASPTIATDVTVDVAAVAGEEFDGAAGNITVLLADDAGVSAGSETVSFDNVTQTLTVNIDAGNTTAAQLETAIEAFNNTDSTADFAVTLTGTTSNTISLADIATYNGGGGTGRALSGGRDQVDSTITFSPTSAGASFNRTITFSQASDLGDGQFSVTDDGTTLAIDIDDDSPIDLAALTTAIEAALDANDNFNVTLNNAIGNGQYIGGSGTDTRVNVGASTLGVDAGGLASAVVFELSGSTGTEVLSFGAGTSISELVSGINLVSDATGVQAGSTSQTLNLTSTAFGTSSVVDINIISEGTGSTPSGTFTSAVGQGQRSVGSDVIASVNGVAANGDGNDITINTATLDLGATLTAGFTGTASFTITGGGALFQLGPDVVSNQQARLGIGGVNTASLGGVNGLLYQLGSGESADLSTDATTAASIVEEAINQVTSLRGRLGAFQRTTLETNKNALNDTLANLTEAESSIRDADFAEETANLTRTQILVQSGTRVLAIANQNPQNVLALLG